MKKYTKINLGLLTVITGLILVLLLTKTDQQPESQVTVSAIDKQSITEISIRRNDQQDVVIDKLDDSWRMVAPEHARANDTRINTILSLLSARSYTQLNADDTDLARFDLVNPAVTLTLNQYKFQFGNSNPLEGRRYLLFQDRIHLIDDGLYQQLLQPAIFFIDGQDE